MRKIIPTIPAPTTVGCIALGMLTLTASIAQANAVPPSVPVPPEVAAGIIIANELTKPKPFCRVIKVFKKKKRC